MLVQCPDLEWKWLEQPLLGEAHQRALDWLVEFDGADDGLLRDGLLRVMKVYTLFDDEFSLVFGRLVSSSAHRGGTA